MKCAVTLTLLCLVCQIKGKATGSAREKRATCDPVYSNLSPQHSMCQDPSPNATPDPFTKAEGQIITEQHIAYRAQEDAAGMMKPIWDDDIAIVAQKWIEKCGETGAHESNPIYRFVPSLLGVYIGQNVASYYGAGYTLEAATDLWHQEINDFEYGIGNTSVGAVVGHYTQVVLNDVSRIGCGRAYCMIDGKNWTKIACNYARGQFSSETKRPFSFCADASCKTNCKTRDTNGLCDCGGLMCLNDGTLDKTTCTCRCKEHFTGLSCETVDCASISDKSYCTNKDDCRFTSRIAACPTMCGVCPSTCSKTCQNGGALNTYTCTCNCPEGTSGDLCENTTTVTENPICAMVRANNLCILAQWGRACC